MAEGTKYDQGKLRFDLLPVKPLGLVAEVYTIGAKKYADRNWELGIQWGRVFGALLRHAFKWWGGERRDPDGQHHLASVVWCALALMEYEETHQELDDRKVITKAEPENYTGPGRGRVLCMKCGLYYNARDTHASVPPLASSQ